ncbi:MAG TPA: protein kinase family protein, partial [Intrasporangium sp.]|nr:protein kinase family protein [Intrasporangium sp.]
KGVTQVHGIGPGTVLGGRYAVTLRTSEGPHHERWRATDNTLDREVVLVCFPVSASVASATLDAARRAAGIEDPRLVRVLDAGTDVDIAFVVEEPLTGAMPLSHILHAGGLPAEEVRRIVGEAASALEKARHRGLHHLTLTPSSILRMPDGDVKVRGLATDAALVDAEQSSDEQASRIDAVGLVKLIYAGLTGRWPAGPAGASRARPVGLEPAPTMIGGVAAPSEIAVGIPNDLDLICRMTLNEDRGPVSPGDLALQIAPWPSEPPTSDGATGIRLPAQPSDITPTGESPALAPRYGPADAGTSGELYARLAGRRGIQGSGADTGGAANGSGAAAGGAGGAGVAAGAAAAAGAGVASGGASAGEPLKPAGAATGVASAMGERVGSFARAAADKAAARAADRRIGRHDQPFDGEDIAIDQALEEPPTAEIAAPLVFGGTPERPTGAQSRIALAIVGALVLVALVIGINNVAKIGESDGPAEARPTVTVTRTRATPAPSATTQQAPPPTTPSETQSPDGQPVSIVGGSSFDPQDDGEESPNQVPLAFDGDPSTAWKSRWYGSDTYNRSKEGVGLVLDLSAPTKVREVELTLPAAQDVSVFLADEASLDRTQEIGKVRDTSGTVTIKAPSDIEAGTKVIVWVTRPAPDEAPNHYRAQIAEVVVR